MTHSYFFPYSTVGTHGILMVSSLRHLHRQRLIASVDECTPEPCLNC